MAMNNMYGDELGNGDELGKNPANYAALTPLDFIERAAAVYPDRPAVVHGAIRRTWKETRARARRLASALAAQGLGAGDQVAAILPTTPEMFEAHFGCPTDLKSL